MKYAVTENINRLSLHDSCLEGIEETAELTIATFYWGCLADFKEQGLQDPIILGNCRFLIKGFKEEEFRVYTGEGKTFDVKPRPTDLHKHWEDIINTEIDEVKKEIVLNGMFVNPPQSDWIEWKFNYETITIEWNHFVKYSDWENGAMPEDLK